MSDDRFEACLPIILKWEGGNDDDPHDHGGRTSRGITQREYDKWRAKWGKPAGDVWNATTQEIKDIYYGGYWLPRCPKLRPGVDLMYFNICVNAGPSRAETILMKSIGGSDAHTVDAFYQQCSAFYHGLAQFPRYGKGWMHRLDDVYSRAKKMVISPAQSALKQEKPVTQVPVTPTLNQFSLPSLAEIDKFVEGGQKILPIVSMFAPQIATPLGIVLTVLDKILDAGSALQEGKVPADQMLPHISALFNAIAEDLKKLHTQASP